MASNPQGWFDMFATACMAGGGFAAVYYPVHIHLARRRKSRTAHEIGTIVKAEIDRHEESLRERTTEFVTKIDERFDKNDRATVAGAVRIDKLADDVQQLRVDFARETGGNGGGIRQAVNAMSNELSTLSGAFNQHVRENNNNKEAE